MRNEIDDDERGKPRPAPNNVPSLAIGPACGPILVAEDNATNRIVIQRQLQVLGLTAVIAVDGQDALLCSASRKLRPAVD